MISDVRGWGLIIGIEINPACAFAAPEVRVDIVVLTLQLNHHLMTLFISNLGICDSREAFYIFNSNNSK